jgi:malate dehydrogenase
MDLLGPSESSRWVSGRGIAAVVQVLDSGGLDEPICLSVPLDEEYGYEDVWISVPVHVTSTGWETIRRWDLANDERVALDRGYEFLCELQKTER